MPFLQCLSFTDTEFWIYVWTRHNMSCLGQFHAHPWSAQVMSHIWMGHMIVNGVQFLWPTLSHRPPMSRSARLGLVDISCLAPANSQFRRNLIGSTCAVELDSGLLLLPRILSVDHFSPTPMDILVAVVVRWLAALSFSFPLQEFRIPHHSLHHPQRTDSNRFEAWSVNQC